MKASQKGFAIGGALLLLAVLAVLGLSLTKIFLSSQEGAARSAMGAKALQAAKAGVELGAYQSERLGLCEGGVIRFEGLEEYPVTLSCSRSVVIEGEQEIRLDAWTAVACNAPSCPLPRPSPGYVQRELRLVARHGALKP